MRSDRIFVDTSVIIARLLHPEQTRARINKRLQESQVFSSLGVRAEFKRRVLREALYLMKQIANRSTLAEVIRHVTQALGHPGQNRKRNICLLTLAGLFEKTIACNTEDDRKERALRLLKNLVLFGLDDFERQLSKLLKSSGCSAGISRITEQKEFTRYDFDPQDCKSCNSCGVAHFFELNKDKLTAIAEYLRTIESLTEELKRIQKILDEYLADPATLSKVNVCKEVGDLLIAIESSEIENFYTMNYKESQHLARPLKQNLVVATSSENKDEQVFRNEDPDWKVS